MSRKLGIFLAGLFILTIFSYFLSGQSDHLYYGGDVDPCISNPPWYIYYQQYQGELISDSGRDCYHHYPGCMWWFTENSFLDSLDIEKGYRISFGHKCLYNTKDITQTRSFARGDCFQISDSVYRIMIMFSSEGMRITESDAAENDFILPKSASDPCEWHDYSLVCKSGYYDFFVDGILVHSGSLWLKNEGAKYIIWGAGNSPWHVNGEAYWDYVNIDFNLEMQVTVDITPDTLNRKSKGKWITAKIYFPETIKPEDVDESSITLNVSSQVMPYCRCGWEQDFFFAKFDRRKVIKALDENSGDVELLVSVRTTEGLFKGRDTVRVR